MKKSDIVSISYALHHARYIALQVQMGRVFTLTQNGVAIGRISAPTDEDHAKVAAANAHADAHTDAKGKADSLRKAVKDRIAGHGADEEHQAEPVPKAEFNLDTFLSGLDKSPEQEALVPVPGNVPVVAPFEDFAWLDEPAPQDDGQPPEILEDDPYAE